MASKSSYKPKYANALLDYFGKAPYQTVIKTVVTKTGVAEIETDVANDFPTLAGFAVKIGVHRDTLHSWSKKHEDFGEAYKRAKDHQENFLVVNGNKGLIPPAFAIFTAKNVLGWRDKQPGEEPVPTIINNYQNKTNEELDARIKELFETVEIKK